MSSNKWQTVSGKWGSPLFFSGSWFLLLPGMVASSELFQEGKEEQTLHSMGTGLSVPVYSVRLHLVASNSLPHMPNNSNPSLPSPTASEEEINIVEHVYV